MCVCVRVLGRRFVFISAHVCGGWWDGIHSILGVSGGKTKTGTRGYLRGSLAFGAKVDIICSVVSGRSGRKGSQNGVYVQGNNLWLNIYSNRGKEKEILSKFVFIIFDVRTCSGFIILNQNHSKRHFMWVNLTNYRNMFFCNLDICVSNSCSFLNIKWFKHICLQCVTNVITVYPTASAHGPELQPTVPRSRSVPSGARRHLLRGWCTAEARSGRGILTEFVTNMPVHVCV